MVDKKSQRKRELILSNAKSVFIRKGFTAVTMKDIIEECGISRGGIYLYFSSVDEIFMQVILSHNESKLKETRDSVHENRSFRQLIDDYFDKQKSRLLKMDNSLLMSMHEYRFSHKGESDKEFYSSQFDNTKAIILELLNYGVRYGDITDENVECLAVNIMCFIEGISTMAATFGISEEVVDEQIEFIKNVILKY